MLGFAPLGVLALGQSIDGLGVSTIYTGGAFVGGALPRRRLPDLRTLRERFSSEQEHHDRKRKRKKKPELVPVEPAPDLEASLLAVQEALSAQQAAQQAYDETQAARQAALEATAKTRRIAEVFRMAEANAIAAKQRENALLKDDEEVAFLLL